jgi:hypothetical protein
MPAYAGMTDFRFAYNGEGFQPSPKGTPADFTVETGKEQGLRLR